MSGNLPGCSRSIPGHPGRCGRVGGPPLGGHPGRAAVGLRGFPILLQKVLPTFLLRALKRSVWGIPRGVFFEEKCFSGSDFLECFQEQDFKGTIPGIPNSQKS